MWVKFIPSISFNMSAIWAWLVGCQFLPSQNHGKPIYWLTKIRSCQNVGKKFRYSFGLVPTNNLFSCNVSEVSSNLPKFWLQWPISRHEPNDSQIFLACLDFGMAKIDSKPSRLLVPSDSNPSKLTKVIFFLIPKLICRAHHQIVLLIGHFSSSTVSRTLQVLLCSGYFTGTFAIIWCLHLHMWMWYVLLLI